MILKRIASKGNKKARNCLKCNSRLLNLKDNVVNTCEVCGQQHLVDFYTSSSLRQRRQQPGKTREKPMNKVLLIAVTVYLVGFCVCAVISVPLIMWAVRKNDEEEGYYEPMETPELFGKASLTAWIISTVWFLVLPLYVLMLEEKITGKDKDNEQY